MHTIFRVALAIAFLLSGTDAFSQSGSCSISSSVPAFAHHSTAIAHLTEGQLIALAEEMRAQPDCRVVVAGNGGGTKYDQQLSWDRAVNVIGFMSDRENIDRARFVMLYGQAGNNDMVDIRVAAPDETGASIVAPPFPNLRR